MPRRSTLVVIAILAVGQALILLARPSGAGDATRIATHLVPMRIGEWQGADQGPVDDVSREMLQPDAVIWRTYQNPAGATAELMVIYGHQKATFHSPGQCLLGGGWNIVAKERAKVSVDGRDLEVNRFRVQTGEGRAVVFYGYVQGHRVTPSWVKHQFYLATDRARGRVPMGALVRVIVPVTGSQAAADRAGIELMQGVLPGVLRSLDTR